MHASIAGKVAKPGVATLPNGRHVEIVPIKAADEQPLEGQALMDDVLGGPWPTDGLGDIAPEEILEAARDGGLVGPRRGGLPNPCEAAAQREEADRHTDGQRLRVRALP